MKERPILFSAPMILALLRTLNPKTQTRRLLASESLEIHTIQGDAGPYDRLCEFTRRGGNGRYECSSGPLDKQYAVTLCPYGRPGDRLWVKETWKPHLSDEFPLGTCVKFRADGALMKPTLWTNDQGAWCEDQEETTQWRPSIFMPRWASRLTLEITAVRVERLQDISEEDAIAEGCDPHIERRWWQGYHKEDHLLHQTVQDDGSGTPPDWLIEAKPYRDLSHLNRSAKQEYRILWNSINGDGSWENNPWVWCISFQRI